MPFLALRDGLLVEHGDLRTVHPVDTSRLRRLISDAASSSRRAGSGGALAVQRFSAAHPLAVLFYPLPRSVVWPGTRTSVAEIFVSDPDAPAEIDESALRAFFTLTPAESWLTVLLAQGVWLTDAAAALGCVVKLSVAG